MPWTTWRTVQFRVGGGKGGSSPRSWWTWLMAASRPSTSATSPAVARRSPRGERRMAVGGTPGVEVLQVAGVGAAGGRALGGPGEGLGGLEELGVDDQRAPARRRLTPRRAGPWWSQPSYSAARSRKLPLPALLVPLRKPQPLDPMARFREAVRTLTGVDGLLDEPRMVGGAQAGLGAREGAVGDASEAARGRLPNRAGPAGCRRNGCSAGSGSRRCGSG